MRRSHLIAAYTTRWDLTVTGVARRFGVTRQTVHVWLNRYGTHGLAGLADKGSKPLSCPHQMAPEIEAAGWGGGAGAGARS